MTAFSQYCRWFKKLDSLHSAILTGHIKRLIYLPGSTAMQLKVKRGCPGQFKLTKYFPTRAEVRKSWTQQNSTVTLWWEQLTAHERLELTRVPRWLTKL